MVLEEAVKALFRLTANEDDRIKIAAAGAIPRLVALLGPWDDEVVQLTAAKALSNIAVGEDNLVKIAAAGAIPHLVAWQC